jgi:hypothetical protein
LLRRGFLPHHPHRADGHQVQVYKIHLALAVLTLYNVSLYAHLVHRLYTDIPELLDTYY